MLSDDTDCITSSDEGADDNDADDNDATDNDAPENIADNQNLIQNNGINNNNNIVQLLDRERTAHNPVNCCGNYPILILH